MIRFEYFVAIAERGMISWPKGEGKPHRQALRGGLNYLGSQGWELVSTISEFIFGSSNKAQYVFKRTLGDG
jgi:hypothetical protein